MTIFKAISEALFGPDTSDTKYYSYVCQEISDGLIDSGIWTRALAETEYEEWRARARYIVLRVAYLRQEVAKQLKDQAANIEYRKQLDAAYKSKDYAACFKGWVTLAQQGEVSAMYSVAYMCSRGQGTKKDAYQAYYWAARARLAGHPQANALKSELIPQMMSWDINRAEEEAERSQSTLPILAGPR